MSYSLTIRRPQRVGRMTAPSDSGVVGARRNAAALTSQLNEPGGNQMIGFALAADMAAEREAGELREAQEEYSLTLADMRETDMQRADEQATAQRQHAIQTATINNPVGAYLAGQYSLIPESNRALIRRQINAGIEARERSNQPKSGRTNVGTNNEGIPRGELTPAQVLANTRGIQSRQMQEFDRERRAFDARITELQRQQLFGAQARTRDEQVHALAQERDRALDAIRAKHQTELQQAPQLGNSNRPTTAGTQTQNATQPTQPSPDARQERTLAQAREIIARDPSKREEVERRLRSVNIDPGKL